MSRVSPRLKLRPAIPEIWKASKKSAGYRKPHGALELSRRHGPILYTEIVVLGLLAMGKRSGDFSASYAGSARSFSRLLLNQAARFSSVA